MGITAVYIEGDETQTVRGSGYIRTKSGLVQISSSGYVNLGEPKQVATLSRMHIPDSSHFPIRPVTSSFFWARPGFVNIVHYDDGRLTITCD